MQIVDNFTKVRNDVFLVMYYVSGAETKVFFWIYRQTEGYGKKSDGISLSQFVENIGVSKMQVTRAIAKLKEMKLIKVTTQKNKNGANYFNRYEINYKAVENLVTKCDKGSNKMVQGVVTKCDKGSNKMVHTKDNNTKYNNTKEERENNSNKKRAFYTFSPNIKEKLIEEFITHQIENSEYIKNESAFSITIRKKFNKEDQEQIKEFDLWYLESSVVTKRLNDFKEKLVEYENTYFKIIEAYTYLDTKGYTSENIFYIKRINYQGVEYVNGYDTLEEIEELIKKAED